jgi:hypothetical protein
MRGHARRPCLRRRQPAGRSRHLGHVRHAGNWPLQSASTPMLAPRLAASYKIAMGITMGYMLIQML